MGNDIPPDIEDRLVELSQKTAQVADIRIAPSHVEYEPKAFSNQSLVLGFNSKGQLTSGTQGATSTLAGAAAGVSGAIIAARDEYAASLKKTKEIIDTRQAIELSDLDFKISELTKRKALLDQRLAVAGATSNYDAALEKQQVDQQLALLQAQQNLVKAQQTGDSSLETAKHTADVAVLNQQVQLLQQQIDLLKKQAELEKLKSPGAP